MTREAAKEHNKERKNETYSKSHRCEGTRSNICRILKDYQKPVIPNSKCLWPGWRMMPMRYDMEWDTWYPSSYVAIRYCPFCGVMLE